MQRSYDGSLSTQKPSRYWFRGSNAEQDMQQSDKSVNEDNFSIDDDTDEEEQQVYSAPFVPLLN